MDWGWQLWGKVPAWKRTSPSGHAGSRKSPAGPGHSDQTYYVASIASIWNYDGGHTDYSSLDLSWALSCPVLSIVHLMKSSLQESFLMMPQVSASMEQAWPDGWSDVLVETLL